VAFKDVVDYLSGVMFHEVGLRRYNRW